KPHITQDAGNMRATLLFDCGDAICDTAVTPRPVTQRGFQTRALVIGASLYKASPSNSGSRVYLRRGSQPLRFAAFPAAEHLREEVFAIAKMPVKAALTRAQIARQQFDADGFDTLGGETCKGSTNPIIGLKRRGTCWGCGRHSFARVRLGRYRTWFRASSVHPRLD